MKDIKSGLSKGIIQQTLENVDVLARETNSIFNYLKTAEKLPSYIYFSGYMRLDAEGLNIEAAYDKIGNQEHGEIIIPIKAYLLDYELEKFIQNFKFEKDS